MNLFANRENGSNSIALFDAQLTPVNILVGGMPQKYSETRPIAYRLREESPGGLEGELTSVDTVTIHFDSILRNQ